MGVRLAEAAESTHPDDAIRLYEAEAEKWIDQRKREAYAQAAEYLARIKKLSGNTASPDVWRQIINRIREEYRRLPALMDELNKAKLT
jgi:uncharacterized Zn finger protein